MDLGYQQNGYGLAWSPRDVLALPWRDALDYRDILDERNRANQKAMEGK